MFEYYATVLKVIDGDTVDFDVDLGFDVHMNMRVRLAGIDAPEMRTKDGMVSRSWLILKLPVGSKFLIRTDKDRKEKYGRYLATVFPLDGSMSINDKMIEAGHAKKYTGGAR